MNRKSKMGMGLACACALAVLCGAGCKAHGGEGVMARVNGRKIMRTEVETYYRNQTQGQPDPSPDQAQALRLNILHELIDNEIISQRAEKLGLMATDQEVDDKLKEIRAPFSNQEFDERLKQRGVTLDDFKRDVRRTMTVDKVLHKEVDSKINVGDDDIANYYNQHKAEFNLIVPQYHLAQILVTTAPNAQVHNLKNDKAQSEDEAKKKVQMLATKLGSGEDFATLAMNYSEQPDTASSGGDLGFIPENSLQGDRQAYEAISRLKAGDITPPLPAGDEASHKVLGYRIIKLISKEAAGQRELKDPRVREAIREQLHDRREQLLKNAYLETLHNSSSIENYLAEQILKSNGQ